METVATPNMPVGGGVSVGEYHNVHISGGVPDVYVSAFEQDGRDRMAVFITGTSLAFYGDAEALAKLFGTVAWKVRDADARRQRQQATGVTA